MKSLIERSRGLIFKIHLVRKIEDLDMSLREEIVLSF